MEHGDGHEMYVFRDGRTEVSASLLRRELEGDLRRVEGLHDPKLVRPALVGAVIRAGELECGFADLGSEHAPALQRITDELASSLVGHDAEGSLERAGGAVRSLSLSGSLHVSPPEGFAYYGLHPLDYADLADSLSNRLDRVCVIGIRTIGLTLSSVVMAALRRQGKSATRTTVRPHGHPYDRRTSFDPAQLEWLARERAQGASAIVVDEGPGMSGSSFLSVADALRASGFAPDHIDLFCSRRIDPSCLLAPDGARRWSELRSHSPGQTPHRPADAASWIGGGQWRRCAYADETCWPPSWPTMERPKFLSDDQRRILKFEGLGRYGAGVLARAQALAEIGFGAPLEDAGHGFLAYANLAGSPMRSADASAEVLTRLAQYCAARGTLAPAPRATNLEPMMMQNLLVAHGSRRHAPHLDVVRPVISDSRMMPHEWILTKESMFKCDAATHGDDHFFPGPVDIAWDVAGTIVEWHLAGEASEYFIDAYERASGDRVRSRVAPYLFAYTLFRLGCVRMAACSVDDVGERARLMQDYAGYRARLARMLDVPIA
jgi:hypothetical protein